MSAEQRLDRRNKRVRYRLGLLMKQYQDRPDLMHELKWLYGQTYGYEQDIESLIDELTQMYVRNGSYIGDMIGWLPDDFDFDDTDEDEDDSDEATKRQ